MGDRVKQAQPFKNFGSFDLGGEFIHGSNTLVNKLALNNGFLILPVSSIKNFFICWDGSFWEDC